MFLQALQYIGCGLTALVGLYAMFKPNETTNVTGLEPVGSRGITEIRVVFGTFFIVLGFFPIITRNIIAFQMLGYAYLLVGITRILSIFVDKSGNQSNWFSVAFELFFGIILIL